MVMRKTKNNCRREGVQQIHLPKCCQQPRSRGSKPRTDFSPFVCSTSSPSPSSSPPNDVAADRLLLVPYHRRRRQRPGSVLEFSSCKDALPSVTTSSMEQGCQGSITQYRKDMPERLFSNSVGVTVNKDESVAQNTLSDTCDNRNIGRHKSEIADTSDLSHDKSTSQATRSNDVWITPGSIVWAKTANRMWWPAEIMEEGSAQKCTNNEDVNGYIFVQYCGNHERAWVDPVEDLSQFEDCFEEKSCNPMEAFQDALKQALHKKENINSCRPLDGSPDVQFDQSSDKWNASSSSRTEGEYPETGRGKRKRKPKVHFDVTFPIKSVKKLRRFRIMRYLGLTAPIGSPFSLTPHVSTVM